MAPTAPTRTAACLQATLETGPREGRWREAAPSWGPAPRGTGDGAPPNSQGARQRLPSCLGPDGGCGPAASGMSSHFTWVWGSRAASGVPAASPGPAQAGGSPPGDPDPTGLCEPQIRFPLDEARFHPGAQHKHAGLAPHRLWRLQLTRGTAGTRGQKLLSPGCGDVHLYRVPGRRLRASPRQRPVCLARHP